MHIARKRFGQNFLQDAHFVRACIDAIRPVLTDTLVEIGPGLGALTRPLLAQIPHLHVVEIDRDLIARLEKTYPTMRRAVPSAAKLNSSASPPWMVSCVVG